jgi:phage shock protein A
MPLQPIDLQTLFVRLQQVGQEQSAVKDAATQAQAVAGQEIVQKSTAQASTVNVSPELQDQLENVNDAGQREQGRQEAKRRKKKERSREDADLFRDPDLGQNIDISG